MEGPTAVQRARRGGRERRRNARKLMLAVLDSRRYETFAVRFATVLRHGPPRTFTAGRTPILELAPAIVERRQRQIGRAHV